MEPLRKRIRGPTSKVERSNPTNKAKVLGAQLVLAVEKREREKVIFFLDKLHRMGFRDGFAMEEGRKFIRGERSQGERR